MLIGVLEPNIENGRLFAAIQTFLKLFFGDAFDGHGAILAMPPAGVKFAGALWGMTPFDRNIH